jgi:hypothetical protein
LGVTFAVISQGVKTACEVQLQRKLGNVEADIEDRCIVLTHTCRIRATIIFELSCSNNGSSLGQWARVKHAPGRITSKRMPGTKVPTRTVIRPVATGGHDSSLAIFLKTAKQDKSEDTRDTDEHRFSKAARTRNISEHTPDVSVWRLPNRMCLQRDVEVRHNSSPSPYPSPPGEGEAIGRCIQNAASSKSTPKLYVKEQFFSQRQARDTRVIPVLRRGALRPPREDFS